MLITSTLNKVARQIQVSLLSLSSVTKKDSVRLYHICTNSLILPQKIKSRFFGKLTINIKLSFRV